MVPEIAAGESEQTKDTKAWTLATTFRSSPTTHVNESFHSTNVKREQIIARIMPTVPIFLMDLNVTVKPVSVVMESRVKTMMSAWLVMIIVTQTHNAITHQAPLNAHVRRASRATELPVKILTNVWPMMRATLTPSVKILLVLFHVR